MMNSITATVSIREKQIEVLKCMLNFNQPLNPNPNLNEPSWKVLIYDEIGQDIISPLLSIKDLRDLGVTAYLLLRGDRDPIPDVPAVYFVAPTNENIKRLCQDFRNQLYESYYLNFISPIPRNQLEDIAQAAIAANCVHQVSKVFDQYLNFISLEDDLFALRNYSSTAADSISYYALNRSDAKDTDIIEMTNTIADCLFSVFVTMGCVPIIRCPKGNAAEEVAKKLDKKLRDNLRDTRNSLFLGDSTINQMSQLSFQRPVLILMDRSFDLATPLHHTWTYQALAHDLLNLKLNRIELPSTAPTAVAAAAAHHESAKNYDLSSTSDKFWRQQKGNPFPTVAESIQEELEKYKQSESEIMKLKHTIMGDGGEHDESSLLFDSTTKLTAAVSSLPEFWETKRLLDMHTNIATALLDHIKKRKLDVFFETEEKIMSKSTLEKSVLEIINDPDGGSSEDKLRLFMIYYLMSGGQLTQADLDDYLKQLNELKCDTDAIKYLKRYKSFCKMSYATSQSNELSSSTVNKFSSLLSKSSKFVFEGVKNLVVKQQNLPLTRICDHIIEQKASSENEEYCYFDPKLIKTDGARSKAPFNDAIVFMVGGGNYIEYQNLLDNAKFKSVNGNVRRIIYGCTELVNATMLLKQLNKLGKEMS